MIKREDKEYYTDDDYIETYNNMSTMYKHFSNIVSSAVSAYNSVLKLDFKDTSLDVVSTTIGTLLTSLPEKIIKELEKHEELYSNIAQLDNVTKAFEKYNDIIDETTEAYNSIIESLNDIGISGNDTTVIETITNNLNTMVSKLAEAIKIDTISLDAASANTFVENVSKFSSAIEQLADTYSLVPGDFTKYENLIKAIEGVNLKITEIKNIEAFEKEQQALEKYVTTLNNLDLTKVETLSNLMSVMNELASKLGSLDKFTAVLNEKISVTLSNLAKQIKISGDIINKADNLQKKRHEAIKSSIKEIQSIMDQKLIVEVNHIEIQPDGGDYSESGGFFGSPSENTSSTENASPTENKAQGENKNASFGERLMTGAKN